MYHSVGGVVATGAVLVSGGSVVIREKFSAQRVLGRRRALGLHAVPVHRRAVPLSGQRAAASATRRAHRLRLCLRQRPAARHLGRVQDAVSHPAHPRVLRRDRRQRVAVQLSRASPARSAASRRSSRTAFRSALVQFDVDDRTSRCATRTASASAARRTRPAKRSARSPNDPREAGQPLRGLYRPQPRPSKKILRDVFEHGRRLVSHRRPDAQGRGRLFLFRRPHRRHLPLEGRERLDLGSRRRRSPRFPASPKPTSTACAVPGNEGRAGMAAIVIDPTASSILRALHRLARPNTCRPMRGRCSCACAPRLDVTATFKQKKFDLVREGFDPAATTDPIYFNDPQAQRLRAARRGALRRDQRGSGWPMTDRTTVPNENRRTCWRSGAAAGPENGLQATTLSMTRSARGSLRPTRPQPPESFIDWEATAEGALALVIVLDQFPRNMFRDDARAFCRRSAGAAVADRAMRVASIRRLHAANGSSSICRSSIRNIGEPGALRRAVAARSATPNAEMGGTARRHHPPVRPLPPSQRRARPRNDCRGAGLP